VTKIHSLIVQNPVFACLSEADLAIAMASGHSRKYRRGHLITVAGDIWPYLFMVISGQVKALKESSEGRTLVIATFEPGSLFWGLAFFEDDLPMPVTLEARQDSHLYLWERQRFLPFQLKHGRLSLELNKLMIHQMLRASEIVESLAFQPVAGRVACLLLDLISPDQPASSRTLTLDEMAAHIGTTREMVCRSLHSFSDAGLIKITRTEFSITDRQGLQEFTRR
jgi:CRP/FNR family transcriptional regulator